MNCISHISNIDFYIFSVVLKYIFFSGGCAGQRASEASDQASIVWTTIVQAFSETFGSGVSRETSKSCENNFSLIKQRNNSIYLTYGDFIGNKVCRTMWSLVK